MKKYILLTTALLTLNFSAYAAHPHGTVYADVNGLVCDFCARALEKVFAKEDAVESIQVDMDSKVITIHFNEGQSLADEVISKLIIDSGYDVRGIRHAE